MDPRRDDLAATELRLRLPSQPEAIGTVRTCVSEYARAHGLANADEIVVAACQMCADAVLRAFHCPRDDGHFELSAKVEEGCVRLDVTDQGDGDVRARDLGLTFLERMAEDVRVTQPGDGETRVRARFARQGHATCRTGP